MGLRRLYCLGWSGGGCEAVDCEGVDIVGVYEAGFRGRGVDIGVGRGWLGGERTGWDGQFRQ